MQVKIRAMGTLRKIVGVDEIILKNKSIKSVKDLINLLIQNYPALKKELLDPIMGSVEPNALIIVNGIEINNIKGTDTPLQDGSEIVFLSVTHGGW